MKALLIIDVQNDFLEEGSLPIPNSNYKIHYINTIIDWFKKEAAPIIAVRDWHPINHDSFASSYDLKDYEKKNNITKWPVHCIQNSYGAKFPKLLKKKNIKNIFNKGTDIECDSLSAFIDAKNRKHNDLLEFLKENQINTLYIVGFALDYCVMYSAIDALKLGFEVTIDLRGTAFINKKRSQEFIKNYQNKIHFKNLNYI